MDGSHFSPGRSFLGLYRRARRQKGLQYKQQHLKTLAALTQHFRLDTLSVGAAEQAENSYSRGDDAERDPHLSSSLSLVMGDRI